jgi:hypothetical protein
MLLEVTEEHLHQEREKKGVAFVVVVRENLLRIGFNLTSSLNIKLTGSDIENDLLLLHSTADLDQKEYTPNKINRVIAVKNNAVANQSSMIKENLAKTAIYRVAFCNGLPLRKNRYQH